jgi:tRNA A-37 threonylcarbamoyl transferase component Bud32/Ethanolamine utilization protein EutJ (predicted chaperonin)
VPSPNGDAWIRISEHDFCPEELVAAVLRYLAERARAALGAPVAGAVIAVPCTFDQHQRRALAWACELADLEVVQLVHQSSALAHALGPRGQARRVAVVDLGAGHFEVSLLERSAGAWAVLAAAGDGILGGLDFDRRVIELLEPRPPFDAVRLAILAERVRHALGSTQQIRISQLLRERGGVELGAEIVQRRQHDAAVHEELASVAPPCAKMFDDVSLGTDDVDEVLLVGGMAHVPAVVEEVRQLFRRDPTVLADGGTLTALGALRAALVHDQGGQILAQLVTRRIGVKVRGGLVSTIIPRRRRLPITAHMPFAAPLPGQRRFVFEVYEGDAAQASDNLYLGNFVLEPLVAGQAPTVTFGLDESGVLQIPEWSAGNHLGAVEVRWAGGRKSMPVSRPDQSKPAGERSYARLQRPPSAEDIALSGTQRMFHDDRHAPSSFPPPSSGADRKALPRRPGGSMPAPPAKADEKTGSDPLLGTLVGERYLIEDIIGEGAMGRVYLASHRTLGRKFAVKVLHPELANNDELASRFLREAQSASRIDSDHVIDIVDFGRLADGAGYFVMEFLKGNPLRALMDERGALPPEVVADIGQQVAEGVGAAHDIGIIHRDLKPDNIIVMRRKAHVHYCKILDFGIAKHPTSSSGGPITLAGTMVGSPYYMAPEQIIGDEVDARTDIYSLGVMLYEMATGKTPFHADSVALLLHKHLEERPAPVRSHEASARFPEALEAVILRCLAKDPEDRVPSAAELVKLLREAL